PLWCLASGSSALALRPPTSPTSLALEVETQSALFTPEWEPDPPVQGPRGSFERPPELFRVIALLEGEATALLRRELLELLPVLLDERQELGGKSVLEFSDRHGLELGHVAAPYSECNTKRPDSGLCPRHLTTPW